MINRAGHRISGRADQRISGLADQRINGSADQRTSGLTDQRTSRISGSADQPEHAADQRISGPADQRISGPADQRTSGPADQRISESADQRTQRISGSTVQRISGSDNPTIISPFTHKHVCTPEILGHIGTSRAEKNQHAADVCTIFHSWNMHVPLHTRFLTHMFLHFTHRSFRHKFGIAISTHFCTSDALFRRGRPTIGKRKLDFYFNVE